MADGDVSVFQETIDPRVYVGLSTRIGGEFLDETITP
jgi:hypothetical protein